MRKAVPYLVLLLALASILVPVGVGYAKGTVQPALPVELGQLNASSFAINPCKYVYYDWMPDKARVSTTICNFSDKDATFNLGDGSMVVIEGNSKIEHKYLANLDGQTQRIYITKLAEGTGIRIQEALVLKIEPRKE